MHAGAEGGSKQVISMLMRAGAGKYINDQAPLSGLTPLHLAVSGGKLAATKVLVLAGADVNKLDAGGVAPLHLALQDGHAELAQVLLLGRADADKQLRNGNYPIHLAARRGEDGVLRSLLHKGAKVDRRGFGGSTPLCHALDAGHIPTVNFLLAGGASGWGRHRRLTLRGDHPSLRVDLLHQLFRSHACPLEVGNKPPCEMPAQRDDRLAHRMPRGKP
ncbi:unnamed protein product [Ectocarpus sp. 12 AP-2014]